MNYFVCKYVDQLKASEVDLRESYWLKFYSEKEAIGFILSRANERCDYLRQQLESAEKQLKKVKKKFIPAP
jgi:hypothetical protein